MLPFEPLVSYLLVFNIFSFSGSVLRCLCSMEAMLSGAFSTSPAGGVSLVGLVDLVQVLFSGT